MVLVLKILNGLKNIQDINENAINFISSISELDEDKQKLIEDIFEMIFFYN